MPSLKYSEFMDEINEYGKDWPTTPEEIRATQFIPKYAIRESDEVTKKEMLWVWTAFCLGLIVVLAVVWATFAMSAVAVSDQERTKIEGAK